MFIAIDVRTSVERVQSSKVVLEVGNDVPGIMVVQLVDQTVDLSIEVITLV